MRAWIISLCTIGVLAGASSAQSERSGYDLQQCIEAALQNDPDLQAAGADLAMARAQLAEARAGRFGQSEYTQILGAVQEAKGDILDPPRQNRNALFEGLGPFTRIDVSINIPLWTFGKLSAALEAAQQGLAAQQAGHEVRRADAVLNVKRLYYGVLLTDQLSAILRDMSESMDKAVRKTQERLDANSSAVTEIDLLKLKTGRSKFAKGVAEVEAAAMLTRSALARVMGLDMNEKIELAEQRLQPVQATVLPLERYLAEGPERRPEARQLSTGIAAQSAQVEIHEAALYPSVFLATGFQYGIAPNRTRQRNPFASEEFNYTRPVGALGIHWDLNFFRNSAKIDQARADLERLLAQQRGANSGLQLEIRKAYADLVQARDTMQATEEGRRAGRSLLVLTVSNFDLGIGEAEELFEGLGAYTESSSDHLRAVHDYNVAVGALSKAVGAELTDLQY